MEVEYLREMRQNYLMIQVEESREQGYEARMMIGNTIDGLLRFRIKKSDKCCRFCYEITSKQPLSRLLEKKAITAAQLRGLILGIARTTSRFFVCCLGKRGTFRKSSVSFCSTFWAIRTTKIRRPLC